MAEGFEWSLGRKENVAPFVFQPDGTRNGMDVGKKVMLFDNAEH